MAEVLLDKSQIYPCFQKMGGIGVPQRMNTGILIDFAFLQCILENEPYTGP